MMENAEVCKISCMRDVNAPNYTRLLITADFSSVRTWRIAWTFTESCAEGLRTHANNSRTFAFISERGVFTFRESVVLPHYFP